MYGTSKNPKQTLVDIIYSQKEDEKSKEFRAAEAARADQDRAAREAQWKAANPNGVPAAAADAGAVGAGGASPAPAGAASPSPAPSAAGGAGGATPSASPFPSPAPASVVGAGTAAATTDGKAGSSPAPAAAAGGGATPPTESKEASIARDRTALGAGVDMIKIPKWGERVRRKYHLVEVKRAGEKGKPDTTEWAIKWESKGKKAADTTFFISGCQLFKGHQKGYFKDRDNQKKYPATQCFTLFSSQREMDLYCCEAADFPKWMNVLTPLVSKVVEPPSWQR